MDAHLITNSPSKQKLKMTKKKIEIWKDVVGYEGKYVVSSFGRIKSLSYNKTNKVKLLVQTMRGAYLKVSLFNSSRKFKITSAHRIVAQAFHPNPDSKPQVNHKDGNKLNNFADNLEWVTHKENAAHALKNNLLNFCVGENIVHAKLSEKQVLEVRGKYQRNTYGYKRLAKEYNLHPSSVVDIIRGKTWKHLPCDWKPQEKTLTQ